MAACYQAVWPDALPRPLVSASCALSPSGDIELEHRECHASNHKLWSLSGAPSSLQSSPVGPGTPHSVLWVPGPCCVADCYFVFRGTAWACSEPSSSKQSRITPVVKTFLRGWRCSRHSQTTGDTSPIWKKSWVGACWVVSYPSLGHAKNCRTQRGDGCFGGNQTMQLC